MTIFNSQKRNNDPRPYYIAEDDSRRTVAEIEADAGDERFPNGGILYNLAKWSPRPEFDNNPNPILIDFRRSAGLQDYPAAQHATWWLRLREIEPDMTAQCWQDPDFDFTEEQHDHAWRVLTRLAAFATDPAATN